MSQCVTTATATLFTTETSIITSVSTSLSTTTDPPQTVTSTIVDCLQTATDGTCNSTSIIVETSTVSGVVTTIPVQVPFTIANTVTQATATLFSTSCTSSSSSSSSSPSSPASSPNNTGSNGSSTSSVLVASTPVTLIPSSVTSTFSNGSVATELITITSTLPVTSVYVPTTLPNLSPTGRSQTGPSKDIGPIVGGAVGGFVGLFGLAGLLWLLWRRRSARWDDIFDDEPGPAEVQRARRARTLDLVEEIEPKPYQYGLVGHPGSNPQVASSPPPSRPPSTTLDHGSIIPLNLQSETRSHAPQLSLQAFPPYNLSPSSTQPNTASASRPSTANSINPLIFPQTVPHQRRPSYGAQSLSGDHGYFGPPPTGPTRSQSATAVVPQSPEWRDRHNSRMSVRPSSADMDMDNAIPLQPRSVPSTPTSLDPSSSRGPLQLANPSDEPSPSHSGPNFAISPGRLGKSGARRQSGNHVIVHQDAGRANDVGADARPSQALDEPPAYST